jgi:hypothetical protein
MQTQSLSSSSSSATSLMIQNANALPMQRAPIGPGHDTSTPGTPVPTPCGSGGIMSYLVCHQYPRGSCGPTELCSDINFGKSSPSSGPKCDPAACPSTQSTLSNASKVASSLSSSPLQISGNPFIKQSQGPIQCIRAPCLPGGATTDQQADGSNALQKQSSGHIECIRYPCTPGSTNTGQNMLSNGATHPTKPYYPPPNGPHQTQGENPGEGTASPTQ